MAIEIVGNPEDVKRYRKILHDRGIYTKRVKDNDSIYSKKDEDFRLLMGTFCLKKEFNVKQKEMGVYDPEDKLYIKGVANANIVDRIEERLNPSGLDARNFMKNKVLLSDHMYWNQSVIGKVESLQVEEDGVHFEAYIGDPRLAPLTDLQKDIRSLVAQRLLQTVSVGFIPKKIKAPMFDNEGRLVEPAIIEEWELLELSIVAVPCNPDATFEMREYYKNSLSFNNGSDITKGLTLKDNKEDNSQGSHNKAQSTTVQTLIFDKELFTVESSKKWAKDQDYKSEYVDETDETIRLRQRNPEDFIEGSFRTIELTDGVKAVIGKLKEEGSEMDEKTAQEMVEGIKGLLTSVQQLISTTERNISLSETILGHFESKGKPKDEKEDKPMVPPEDEEKPPKDDEEKEKNFDVKGEIKSIKEDIGQLAEIVKALAERQ